MGWIVAAVAGFGVLTVLFAFDPSRYGFYPRCMFHQMTGLSCPGCGGLRAAHQLLHGHFREAFMFNPLLMVLLPVLAWLAFCQLWQAATGRELAFPLRHPAWLWMLLALVVVFSIARNLPIGPFTSLSP